MFRAKTAIEAKVVNLELNPRNKQSKNGMKIDLLKRLLAVNAGTLFRVVWRPHLRGTARPPKPANLAVSVVET